MKKAKRTISVIVAALMLVITCAAYVPANAAEVTTNAPEIVFVGVDHSPLVVGDTEAFSITTKNADKVKYNVVLKDESGKIVEDLTNGWTDETSGSIPYELFATTEFALGKYTLVIDAKRVSDGKTLDKPYIANLNCVSKDNANRIYANGEVDIAKTGYTIGEKVTVNGIKDIGGIAGPYMYKLHVYNATTRTWTKNAVSAYGDKIEWTPTTAGTYVLDIYVNSQKSATWAKYAANPTSEDTYGTYEAWKLITVNVVEPLKVMKVLAENKKTIKVTYNSDLGSVTADNFAVYDKGDEYEVNPVSCVSVDKNVATITLLDSLEDAKEYTVESRNVPAADGIATLTESKDTTKYAEVKTAASIAIKSTNVATDSTVEYIIKDKDGNDITTNIPLEDLTVESSDESIVAGDLTTSTTTGKCIVNIAINDTEIATGNTIITVAKTSSLKPTSIGDYCIYNFQNAPIASMGGYGGWYKFTYKNKPSQFIQFEVLDQNGDEMNWDVTSNSSTPPAENQVTKTFRSLNPEIAAVDISTGQIFPIAPGKAKILVTAEDANKITVNKIIEIEVRDTQVLTSFQILKAEPDYTTEDVTNGSITLVKDSGMPANFTVLGLDQYGFYMAKDPITYKLNGVTETINPMFTTGFYFPFSIATDDSITKDKSVTINLTCGEVKAKVTVNYVIPGDFAGYKIWPIIAQGRRTLDLTNDYSRSKGPQMAKIAVYEVDTNGNIIGETKQPVTLETESKGYITTEGQDVKAAEIGSETLTVKVGTIKIGTVDLKVIDSTQKVTTLSFIKSAISVQKGADVFTALFGTDKCGAAIIGYDQDGKKILVKQTDVKIITSNSVVVNSDTMMAGSTSGTAELVILVGEKNYTVSVEVQ